MPKVKQKQLLAQFEQYRLLKLLDELTNEQQAFVDRIDRAVGRLPTIEQDVVRQRHLHSGADYIRNYHVYQNLEISKATYNTIRDRALSKLALILNTNSNVKE